MRSTEQLFWKMSQSLRKNTGDGNISSIKMEAWPSTVFTKNVSVAGDFLWILRDCSEQLFYKTAFYLRRWIKFCKFLLRPNCLTAKLCLTMTKKRITADSKDFTFSFLVDLKLVCPEGFGLLYCSKVSDVCQTDFLT